MVRFWPWYFPRFRYYSFRLHLPYKYIHCQSWTHKTNWKKNEKGNYLFFKLIFQIFFRSVFWEMTIYLSIAISGYLSFLDNTPDLIILRPALPGKKDILMIIGKLAMTFNLITCLPLSIHPTRREIFSRIFHIKERPKKLHHFLMTLILLILNCIFAYYFPDIISAFSIIGGTCSVGIVIFFPGKSFHIILLKF